MARDLISTPFPSTVEVARKLGLSDSRIRRVAALMPFVVPGIGPKGSAPALKKAVKRATRKRKQQRKHP